MPSLLKKDDQVIYRHQLGNGVAIEIGSIVRLDDDGIHASVHFPTLNKISKLQLDQLQKTDEMFGVQRVQYSPARRTIQTFLQ